MTLDNGLPFFSHPVVYLL